MNGVKIDTVSSTKYLGVSLDSSFKWDVHIDNVCNTIAPKVGLLRKLQTLLPKQCVELVYNLTVWGHAADKYLNRVQYLQNRAARILTINYDWNTRGINLVKDLGWQNVLQRRDYFTVVQVFKALHSLAPDYIQDSSPMPPTSTPAKPEIQYPRISTSLKSQNLYSVNPSVLPVLGYGTPSPNHSRLSLPSTASII